MALLAWQSLLSSRTRFAQCRAKSTELIQGEFLPRVCITFSSESRALSLQVGKAGVFAQSSNRNRAWFLTASSPRVLSERRASDVLETWRRAPANDRLVKVLADVVSEP